MRLNFLAKILLSFFYVASLNSQGLVEAEQWSDSSKKSLNKVVVAIIDTGLDSGHRDFQNFLWKNTGEMGLDKNGLPKDSNGIDDDQNGLIDDVHGWDFVTNRNRIVDSNGHGTHVAGLIKREFLENRGDSFSHLELLPLRYTRGDGKNSKDSFLKALFYAIEQNVQVINISASGRGFSKAEFDLLKKAEERRILVVVATGNKRPGSANYRSYPASYHLKNITAVSALDRSGKVLPSSNQISTKNISYALGENLLSALPGNLYGKKTGTSQAAALVSGQKAALLAFGQDPSRPTHQIVMNPSISFHN